MNEQNDIELTNEQNTIELSEEFIVLAIPASTLEITLEAKVWQDSEVVTVTKTMKYDEVKAAIKEAQDCYIPSDAIFTLTELGKQEVERLKAEYGALEDGSCELRAL